MTLPLLTALTELARPPSIRAGTMVNGLLLAALAAVLTWLIGNPLIRWLRAKKIGKKIRLEGPATHLVKTGTPTMGGLMIIASVIITAVLFILVPIVIEGGTTMGGSGLSILLPIGIMIACGILGGVDDMLSLVGTTRTGLTARFKMSWLLGISFVAALILYFPLERHVVYIPFVSDPIDLGLFYIPVVVFTVAALANAVNLTDGLDTLAGGTSGLAFAAFGVIAYLQGQPQVVLLDWTIVGATLGFLWFNSHPAQVFMGDTGSLTLGAVFAVSGFLTNQWLLLPIVGAVFVVEALSVTLQVAYFRWSHGKRLFLMAPIHHHFEKLGWSETQVTMRFWLFGMVAAMIGVALALV